jgi:hypothetical protein
MLSGYLVYKCRRCGELSKNTHVPDGGCALLGILNPNLLDFRKIWQGIPLEKYDIHTCKDGNAGIADIIGFEKD